MGILGAINGGCSRVKDMGGASNASSLLVQVFRVATTPNTCTEISR